MLQKRNVYVIILATTNDRYRHDQIDIIKKRCERSHLFFVFLIHTLLEVLVCWKSMMKQ